ncbi:MAG: IS481 family transposase [Herbiconiux sp.]|nr:IS481 family transposase [Herbiconiux sp.]
MSHANARTTFHGRMLIVQRHHDGMPQAHIAKAMGISRKCVRTWIKRYAEDGQDGLRDRSSRPHSMPRRTSEELEQKVLTARGEHRRGQDWLGPECGVPARTVGRILRRHDVVYLKHCDPMTGEVIKASRSTAVRYERDHPGSLVHMDIKKLGRVPDGGGWKAGGRQRNEGPRPKTKVGFDYIHTLIDDHSRLAYSEVLADETAETCAAFLLRAAEDFAGRGIPIIEQLMTDNAMAYKARVLAEVCALLEIKQIYIKPHCPWTNGKVERFNRTLQTEWAYARIYLSNDERTAALATFLDYYNTVRRHTSLGGQPPTSRL